LAFKIAEQFLDEAMLCAGILDQALQTLVLGVLGIKDCLLDMAVNLELALDRSKQPFHIGVSSCGGKQVRYALVIPLQEIQRVHTSFSLKDLAQKDLAQ